jgi:hypothetical protein
MDKYGDSHHKMSKKIAQLTKVIFHLHTRNEENEEYQNSFTKAYENELNNVVSKANQIIHTQKSQLDKLRDQNDMKDKLKQLTIKYEAEKKDSQITYEQFKTEVNLISY